MQLQVKGKNLEVSESIRAYAERKLAKIDKQVHELTRVEVELAVERNPSVSANQVAGGTGGGGVGAAEGTPGVAAKKGGGARGWQRGPPFRPRGVPRKIRAPTDETP